MTWYVDLDSTSQIEELQQKYDELLQAIRLKNTKTTDFTLWLYHVTFTPQLLRLMVEVLNVSLPQMHDGVESKWTLCHLCSCKILEGRRGQQNCTLEEINRLTEALATRTQHLDITESTNISQYFLRTRRWEMATLQISKCRVPLSSVDWARLANLLQVSTNLKQLYLEVPTDVQEQVARVMASAWNLEVLSVTLVLPSDRSQATTRQQTREVLLDLGVGQRDHHALARLLQDPCSQLKKLRLYCKSLSCDTVIAIFRLLPTSRLEELHISSKINFPAIMEFAHCLPSIKCLKDVRLNPDDSLSVAQKAECIAALMQGIMQNTSLEDCHHSLLHFISNSPLLCRHLILNRAGQRILSTLHPVPLGLWSYILQRVGIIPLYHHPLNPNPRADAMYFLLQNSPIASHYIRHR